MIDKKGRLFGKINLIDFVVLAAIIIAIAGFGYKTLSGSPTVTLSGDAPIEVTFKALKVREYTVNAVSQGDSIYERNGARLGTVTKVEAKPAREILAMRDGANIYAQVENRYDLYITVEGTGRISGPSYYINSNRLMAAGSDIKLASNKMTCETTITHVGAPAK